MKKLNLFVSFVVLTLVASTQLKAQDTNTDFHTIGITVPLVAILDIEPAGASKNITMGFTAPIEAGNPITPSGTDASLWLNYSTIKSAAAKTLKVSVKLNALVSGVDIKVTAAAATGAGAGDRGAPSAQLTLTAADQIIINGIGSAYTGNGANNGHNLTYVLAPTTTGSAYADLVASTTAVAQVTYTIVEN